MIPSLYYREMRSLALAKRQAHCVETQLLDIKFMQRIYKAEGIRIDRWDTSPRIRAAYFCENKDYSVLINKNLPREPKLFSMAHELKHHYADQSSLKGGNIKCGDYNANKVIEIGAEIFAAEFIYPEDEMKDLVDELGMKPENCTPQTIVEFKRVCPAKVSYSFLVKRFEWFGLFQLTKYKDIRFQKLEEQMYGLPIYKQPWFIAYRAKKKLVSGQKN
jgi:Zn-dependent peptidase ImmA (M78 family)